LVPPDKIDSFRTRFLAKEVELPIMEIGGQAPMALAVMWAFTVMTWIFVVLRLYTRAFVMKQIGADDHAYWLSGVSTTLDALCLVADFSRS
jgi:hypothetical protein